MSAGNAHKLFLGDADFLTATSNPDKLPDIIESKHGDALPEIAFVGRSNVGKSSLINALTNRKKLVRTSHTPGRTQQINFFNLASQLILVDLPGYGYAKVSKSDRKHWRALMAAYLTERASLKRALVLVDARRGLKDSDHEMLALLNEAAVGTTIILTKIDKASAIERDKVSTDALKNLANYPVVFPDLFPTSAAKKKGLEELRAHILSVAGLLGN